MFKLPDIQQNFAEWYQDVVQHAQLADHAPGVRGSMVIRPYGYAIWELIRERLDARIKATGHQNAAFPLLIPLSFLQREADHVAGFAPEIAVVTHAGGKELEEPLVIRPTSETIIHAMFAQWIQSWRDLPLKLNQWSNVVRWEMRPRPFLRTTEFFWQEGHTAHATREEAHAEVLQMLQEYVDLCVNYLAIPVIPGRKSEAEKFPGAEITYTIEGLMQDGKAVQMGTSHLLCQSFAHSFDIAFQNEEGQSVRPWLTSWGATTRLIGALIMTHGDQKGLVLPPLVAPYQVVIVPILKSDSSQEAVMDMVRSVERALKERNIRVFVDIDGSKTPGAKFWHWELRGVPLRLEIGPRDVQQETVVMVDRIGIGKQTVSQKHIAQAADELLTTIQQQLLVRAQRKRDEQWFRAAKLDDFALQLEQEGGLFQTGFCGRAVCEDVLKNKSKGTVRCLIETDEFKICFACENASVSDVLLARSY